MEQLNLILSLPQGAMTATNLGIEGFAWHRRPGSGKFFQGRTIFFDLALSNRRPDFTYLDEGGWRDAMGDTVDLDQEVGALAAAQRAIRVPGQRDPALVRAEELDADLDGGAVDVDPPAARTDPPW